AAAGGTPPADVRARVLRRVDVGAAATTGPLFDLVTGSTATALTTVRPLASAAGWSDHAGGPLHAGALAGGRLTLDAGPGGWRGADFDAGRSAPWSGYHARLHVGGLAVPGAGGFG